MRKLVRVSGFRMLWFGDTSGVAKKEVRRVSTQARGVERTTTVVGR